MNLVNYIFYLLNYLRGTIILQALRNGFLSSKVEGPQPFGFQKRLIPEPASLPEPSAHECR